MPTDTQAITLRLGHSPDPDDAFMWYPLANFVGPNGRQYTPEIDTGRYEFVHVLEDIQSLNERSMRGELEITAISIHQYPYVADRYALTSCGSSMGDAYGPMIVAKQPVPGSDQGGDIAPAIAKWIKGKRIAIPGERTTAWLTFQLMLADHGLSSDDFISESVMFDQIMPKVADGTFDAGLIIHEGQITYQNLGLHKLVDLGQWWTQTRQLPLPLGGNCIRRDVPEPGVVCDILLRSIRHALDHREQAVAFALQYARDMGSDLADQFVGMYVNEWTLDYGDVGRKAVSTLLKQGAQAGLIPDCGPVDFIESSLKLL